MKATDERELTRGRHRRDKDTAKTCLLLLLALVLLGVTVVSGLVWIVSRIIP